MKLQLSAICGLLVLPTLPFAQNVRAADFADSMTTGPNAGPTIASDGNLTAIMYNAVNAPHQVNVVTSDGRGLTWSDPVRIDDDATGATKLTGALIGTATRNLAVSGNNIYACWRDNRNAPSATKTDVYFTRSTDGGATWDANTRIDLGIAPGVGDVRDWIMEIEPPYVHILVSVDPDDASNEEVYLVSSVDNGATFFPAVSVNSQNGVVDVDDIGLAVQGKSVYCVWSDDRSGSTASDDVFLNASFDGGVTFAGEFQVNSSPLGTGDAEDTTHVKAQGNVVFVAWQEELTSTSTEELRGALSVDGGVTFGADFKIGNYVAGSDDTDLAWIDIVGLLPVAAWEDNRGIGDQVFVSVSNDLGASWTDTQIGTNGQFPRIFGTGDPLNLNVGVSYATSGGSGDCELAYSQDGGFTWTGPVSISNSTADVDNTEFVYNELYDNYIATYIADDLGSNNVFAGGVRPQTCSITSSVTGSTTQFDLSGWEPNAPRFVWVLGSNSPGTFLLPFGDGRNLGLGLDGVLLATLNNPTTFLTNVDATGVGTSGSFTLGVPAGITFYQAAVSFDLGPVTLAEISDVVEVDVM